MLTRTGPLLLAIIMFPMLFYYIQLGKKGKYRPLLRIPGLGMIKESVGRATEQGKSIVFSPGGAALHTEGAPYTLTGISVLGYVASLSGKMGVPLRFVAQFPEFIPLAQETIKDAYVTAGVPDFFSDDTVHYPGGGFSYITETIGYIESEKPGACFWIGSFSAESMLFSETGNFVGAMQVAGTASHVQLPFLIASCDYVMIGEEMFILSNFISEDAGLIGSITAQEYSKVIALAIIIIGSLLSTIGVTWVSKMLELGGM